MARIESQAVAGYYATPLHLTGPISALVTFPDVSEKKTPSRYHVMDPCAGDGAALFSLIVNWFGADWRERGRYRNGVEKGLIHVRPSFVEMEQTRFEALRARERKEAGYGTLTDLVHGDALTLNWVPGVYGTDPPGMNVLFLNPPYEPDPVHGRMEHAFLLKFADVPVAGDGVLLFVVPFYALKASARLISCKYEDVRCYRFPDPDFDAYKQVVLCGRRRKFPLDDPDRDLEKRILAWSRSVEGMPTLGTEAGVYPLREQSAGLGALKTMALNVSAVLDRVDPSSLGQSGYDRTVEEMTTRVFPLGMRPREAHIAAAMGAGVFNGVRITANDPGQDHDHGPLLLKAVFTKDWLKVEEKKNKKGETTAVVEQQQPKLNVVVLRLDTSEFAILKNTDQPTMRKALGEWSIADLLLRYGKSLIEAMDRACPALHDPRRKGEALVLPKTLRTPFAAQSEAIQAAVKIAFTGESPYGLGEIGSGKTTLATALLWALAAQNYESTWQSVVRAEQARDKNLGSLSRAFGRARKTAIRPVRAALVLCPPHLLKSWQDQCQAVIPGATVVVIREPADLVRIRALREVPIKVPPTAKPGKVLSLFGDHDQPVARVVAGTGLTVALLTRETAKLGHGYEHGYARNRTGKVSCPKCGTEFEAGTEEDAVRRRTRCEQTISTPANPPALLAIEISHRAAGLIKGGFGAGVLGRSRFGHKARGKTMPGAKDLFRLLTWAAQHPALFKGSYGSLTPAAEALVGAVQALALAWFDGVGRVADRQPQAMLTMAHRQKLSPRMLNEALGLLEFQDITRNRSALLGAHPGLAPVFGRLSLGMRELGLINIGGGAMVVADGQRYEVGPREALARDEEALARRDEVMQFFGWDAALRVQRLARGFAVQQVHGAAMRDDGDALPHVLARQRLHPMFVCQYPISSSVLNGIECDENVANFSGRSCCTICQNVPDDATTRESAGDSHILLL